MHICYLHRHLLTLPLPFNPIIVRNVGRSMRRVECTCRPQWFRTAKNRDVRTMPLARRFACTTHTSACSALLVSLARSTALILSLASSLTPELVAKWIIRCLKRLFPTVKYASSTVHLNAGCVGDSDVVELSCLVMALEMTQTMTQTMRQEKAMSEWGAIFSHIRQQICLRSCFWRLLLTKPNSD